MDRIFRVVRIRGKARGVTVVDRCEYGECRNAGSDWGFPVHSVPIVQTDVNEQISRDISVDRTNYAVHAVHVGAANVAVC